MYKYFVFCNVHTSLSNLEEESELNGVIHPGGFCMSPPPHTNTILNNEEEVAALLKIVVKQVSKYVAIVG